MRGSVWPDVYKRQSQDCMGLVMEMVTDKLQQLCKVKPEFADGRQTYSYIETDFIRALKHG